MCQSCNNCKYELRGIDDYPCSKCNHNGHSENMWEDVERYDAVNHPAHYTDGKIEVIEFIEDKRLIKAGPDHRKFLRQIFVSVDIVAPSFWWPEFDTYKIGTVRDSCSKMHKIHVKSFEKSDFSYEGTDKLMTTNDPRLCTKVRNHIDNTLEFIEFLRVQFNETNDKTYWRALIENLPHGYNMRATLTLNYEVLRNIYRSRRNHKLDEWSIGFMTWIDSLPYAEELIKN